MNQLLTPMVLGLGPGEIAIIVGVIVLLFGASKLPELARGSGRALRIFKAETKGLMDDDDAADTKSERQRELDARERAEADEFDRRHPVRRSEEPGSSSTS